MLICKKKNVKERKRKREKWGGVERRGPEGER